MTSWNENPCIPIKRGGKVPGIDLPWINYKGMLELDSLKMLTQEKFQIDTVKIMIESMHWKRQAISRCLSQCLPTKGYTCTLSQLIEAEWRIYASVNFSIIDSDNGLSPGRCQPFIWTNAGRLSIGQLGANFNEISIEIYISSFRKMHLKMPSGNLRPFCLNVLTRNPWAKHCDISWGKGCCAI